MKNRNIKIKAGVFVVALLFLATTVTVNADRMYISEMALKAEAEIKQLKKLQAMYII